MLADQRSREDLLDSLRAEWAGRSPLVWWDRIVDRTGTEVDISQLATRDDFVGNALRAIATNTHAPANTDTRANTGDAGDAGDEILVPLAHLTPRTERLGVALPDPSDADLLDRARSMVAELLTDGER